MMRQFDSTSSGNAIPATDISSRGAGLEAAHIDEAFAAVQHHVLSHGSHVDTYRVDQAENVRGSKEILGLEFKIAHPRDRVLHSPIRRFNRAEAIGRLVWGFGAGTSVDSISFYQPKAAAFSDNGLTIPGSDYWNRLINPRPGLNQIRGVINTLQREIGSRRGVATIWCAEDSVRESCDYPCALSLDFLVRDNRLNTMVMMRSNNAYLLLPYNVFEFSLLGEMIATTIGVQVGWYKHYACSMHIYDSQELLARQAVAAYNTTVLHQLRLPMPPMPTDPAPFDQANLLARLEVRLRRDFAIESLGDLLRRGDDLHPYWRVFYHVLLAHALSIAKRLDDAEEVAQLIPPYLP